MGAARCLDLSNNAVGVKKETRICILSDMMKGKITVLLSSFLTIMTLPQALCSYYDLLAMLKRRKKKTVLLFLCLTILTLHLSLCS
jgi:hypothetical protein